MHCNDLSLHILPTYAFLQNLPCLVYYQGGMASNGRDILLLQIHAHQ